MADLARVRARLLDRPIACEPSHLRALLDGIADRLGLGETRLDARVVEGAGEPTPGRRARRGYRVENGVAR